jgi:hypothetical protein
LIERKELGEKEEGGRKNVSTTVIHVWWWWGGRIQISSGEREKKGKGRGNGVENRPPGRRLKVGDAVNAWPTSVGGGWARMEDIAVVFLLFFFCKHLQIKMNRPLTRIIELVSWERLPGRVSGAPIGHNRIALVLGWRGGLANCGGGVLEYGSIKKTHGFDANGNNDI